MRSLTITRRKSFVGSMGKDKVYIRDEQSSEITIEGIPCRKIGEIKNGETKTFPISEDEQQIFLIADVLSKERCNASLVINAGQEDISLSGMHYFVLGSNPFRFDGVELTPEQLAKQKKNHRKSGVILIAAAILGLLFGFSVGRLFTSTPNDPKTFTKEGFEITLTDAFKEAQEPGFFSCYSSKTAMVFVLQEEKTLFDDISLDEYRELVQKNGNQHNIQSHTKDGVSWFDYTYVAGDQELYYFAVCYESENAFWVVNFATPIENRDKFADTFLQWAQTLKVK